MASSPKISPAFKVAMVTASGPTSISEWAVPFFTR
jgi:hypothetical protein